MAGFSPVLIGYRNTLRCFFFDEPWTYGPLNLLRPNLFIQAYIMYILDNLLNNNRFKYTEELLQLLSEFKFF